MFSTIVHPTDFSEVSIPALQTAHNLAKELGSKLIVCFIAHSPLVASGDSLTNPTTGESRNITEELESHCPVDQAVQRELRIVVTDQSTRVKTLLGFLEEMSAELLVLGMHKKEGVAGWFGHSITEEIVRRAHCPVLVVKQHAPEHSGDDTPDFAIKT